MQEIKIICDICKADIDPFGYAKPPYSFFELFYERKADLCPTCLTCLSKLDDKLTSDAYQIRTVMMKAKIKSLMKDGIDKEHI